MDLEPLNSKKRKEFYLKLRTYFGLGDEFDLKGVLFVSGKNKFYWVDDKFREIATGLRTRMMGLYIAEISNYGEIRLSIEGSAVIGPYAKEHTLELSKEEAALFTRGQDLDFTERIKEEKLNNQFYIIYNTDKETETKDFLGCGKIKNNELFNFIPKSRRVHD